MTSPAYSVKFNGTGTTGTAPTGTDFALDATTSSAAATATKLTLDAIVKRAATKAIWDGSKSTSAVVGCFVRIGSGDDKFEKYEDATMNFEGATGTTAFACPCL